MSNELTIQLIRAKQDELDEASRILLEDGFDGVLKYIKSGMINPDEAFIIGHRVASMAAEAARELEV